jgi:hypothetical protein
MRWQGEGVPLADSGTDRERRPGEMHGMITVADRGSEPYQWRRDK